MDSENIVTLQLQLTRRKAWLLLTAFFLCWHPGFLGSETLTLTTYYPAPFGGYVSLLTTGRTLLARDTLAATPNSIVGIGIVTPLNKLHVRGNAGGNIDLRVDGRIQTGDAAGAGGVWLSQDGNMFVGQNGTSAAFWTGGNWRFNISQGGVITTGAATPMGGDAAGDVRPGGTLRGLCITVGYSGTVSCPAASPRLMAGYGTVACVGPGQLFLGGGLDDPARWQAHVIEGCGGSMLCCRISDF